LGPVPTTTRRFRLFAALAFAALLAALVLAPGAMADGITPESGGSPNADEIDSLFKIVLAVAIVVFVGVEGTLLYSVLRFRAKKGRVPAQIRGNTNVEIGWTVGAALVLVVLTVVTFIKFPKINDPAKTGANGANVAGSVLYASVDQPAPPGGKALRIEVNGQQYVWRYTYPNDAYSYEEMTVPTNTTVILRVVSQDVIHSWWIPKLGGKVDATPGYTNKTWFKIPKEGVYPGQCAEFCGRGHAEMIARVRAVSPTEYEQWVSNQKKLIDQANADAAKQRRTESPLPQ
jgi:cytochrome c oxidase subunit II